MIIISAIVIVLLLITIAIQSQKKPGKKKSRTPPSQPAGSSSVSEIGVSTWPPIDVVERPPDPIIGQVDERIPGVSGSGPSAVVVVPGEGLYNTLEEMDLLPTLPPTGVSGTRSEAIGDTTGVQSEDIGDISERNSGTIEKTSRLTPIVSESTSASDFDDLPSPTEGSRVSYTPNIEYLKRVYDFNDEIVFREGPYEIDLDNLGKELIPHQVSERFADDYTLTYSLYPLPGHRASYTHHQCGYEMYYMDVTMKLYGDMTSENVEDIVSDNYIIDKYGRTIRASKIEADDSSVTLGFRLRNVDDYIPIHPSYPTFNVLEDRYLIPMVDNLSITESPVDYTEDIILVRGQRQIPMDYDMINGVYAIRV